MEQVTAILPSRVVVYLAICRIQRFCTLLFASILQQEIQAAMVETGDFRGILPSGWRASL